MRTPSVSKSRERRRKHATPVRFVPLVRMNLRSRSLVAFFSFGIFVGAGLVASTGCAKGTSIRLDADASTAANGAELPLPPLDDASADVAENSVTPSEALVVEAFPNCPVSLFEATAKPEDFSSDATLKQSWTTQWVAPKAAAGGSLQLGPHPLTSTWWENYSSMSSIAKPGDVLVLRAHSFGPRDGRRH